MTPEELCELLPWAERPVWRGCDIGPGWVELVHNLHLTLVQLEPDYEVVQVKEKFGGLRYYVNLGWSEDSPAYELIGAAENRSYQICDKCGGENDVTTEAQKGKMWIVTQCATCRS